MNVDLTPEDISDSFVSSTARVQDVIHKDDVLAEPDPTVAGDSEALALPASALEQITWPQDKEAPDYAFLTTEAEPGDFLLSAAVLEGLFTANSFEPFRDHGVVAFALRGAELKAGHEALEVGQVEVRSVRPDHMTLKCLLGFYFLETGKLSVFSGSTVPCRKAVHAQASSAGRVSNMLPTGMYTYHVWRHRDLPVALRLCVGNASVETLERGAVATVLRNRNDRMIDTLDLFDKSTPIDNVHCTYYLDQIQSLGASFSSWGCLTVRGQKTPNEQWQKFVAVLEALGETKRVDLALLTGKEVGVAARGLDNPSLVALRPGSRGDKVAQIQGLLGMTESGYFGPTTADLITAHQRKLHEELGLGRTATGIYTPAFDALSGWGIYPSA